MGRLQEQLAFYEQRCAELEAVVEACAQALKFVPVTALRKAYTWMPSAEALLDFDLAKQKIDEYARKHWRTQG